MTGKVIDYDKMDIQGEKIELDVEGKYSTQAMTDQVIEFCTQLLIDGSKFDEEKRENVFDLIYQYIKTNHRILYSPISNLIYTWFDKESSKTAEKKLATMTANLQYVSSYIETEKYKQRLKSVQGSKNEEKYYYDTEKAILKIWDHVNLAQQQYRTLKQSEDEYKDKFNRSISPIKDELELKVKEVTKKIDDIYSQLLTIVGIFTALAFLLFGGLTSLGNIFNNTQLPILKLIIIGCIWGIGILNTIFVFLFCIEKITNLDFGNSKKNKYPIFRKYLIVWWSDFFLLSMVALSSWAYYIQNRKILNWFENICKTQPQIATILGFVIIILLICLMGKILYRKTKACHIDE